VAIACAACGKKVHEQSVVCPHCGGHSGVAADPVAVDAMARAKPIAAPAYDPLAAPPAPLSGSAFATMLEIGAALVDAIAPDEQRREPTVPRAVARRATRRGASRRRSPRSR
jgi:hypothetical protein